MRILADENIPLVVEAFSTLGSVRTVSGRAISPAAVGDADVLVVRSITLVNQPLLEDSAVKFVGTATIGTDHVDEAYLAGRGIGFAAAPGSNSNSVAEYVVAAILTWAERREIELSRATIGVVGVGHVGSKVSAKARALGLRVLCNDPPRQRAEGLTDFVPLDVLLDDCDIITFHVPLTYEGPDATFHMIDRPMLERFRECEDVLLLNTSRGAVHDTRALLAELHTRRDEDRLPLDVVLDVWEGEPNISPALLEQCFLATPHIAGYSLDGKVAGTVMIYQAACRHFGVEPSWTLPADLPAPRHPVMEVETAGLADQRIVRQAVRHAYDIEWDDAALRRMTEQPAETRGAYFDELRKSYPVRREFGVGQVRLAPARREAAGILAGVGFAVI